MSRGEKHLITCRCTLPQYRNTKNSPLHQFIVFSEIDDNDDVVQKFAQCNNCGIVHKIVGICRSEFVKGQEDLKTVVSIDEIKLSLPSQIVTIMLNYDLDLATWEQAKFIIDNQRWGEFIVLVQEKVGDHRQGKFLRIIGERLFKIESFLTQEYI